MDYANEATTSEQTDTQTEETSSTTTDTPADAQPADDDTTADQQAADEAPQQVDDAAPSPDAPELSAGRLNMLEIIDKWMPTSLANPRIPEGETQDLLAKAGWTRATGAASKKVKDNGGPPTTSCGDVLRTLLKLWNSKFIGAFNIRDTDATGHGPGAKKLGYYVTADQVTLDGDVVTSPKPGDIIVLRNGTGSSSAGSVGHVGVLVEARKDKWRTADGGGGALPDQTASVTERDVRWVNGVPILKSPTDLKEKQLDGWVDLDKLEQTE
jgi:hypothetical protein